MGPGSTVAVVLPVHWQTAAVLLGVWSCGAAVLDTAAEDDGRLADADVVLAAQDRLAALEEEDLADLMGLVAAPAGHGHYRLRGPGAATSRWRSACTGTLHPVAAGRPRRPGPAGRRARAAPGRPGVRGPAAARPASTWRPGAGRRARRHRGRAGRAGCWHRCSAGASIVLSRRRRPRRSPRASAERVTATLGLALDGVRELGRPA